MHMEKCMMTKHYNVQFWASKLKEICTYKTHSCFWLFLFLYLLGLKFKKRMEKDGREWMNEAAAAAAAALYKVCACSNSIKKNLGIVLYGNSLFSKHQTHKLSLYFSFWIIIILFFCTQLDIFFMNFLFSILNSKFSINITKFWILNSLLIMEKINPLN